MRQKTSTRPRKLAKKTHSRTPSQTSDPIDLGRRLNYESLETRCVLSADGLDVLSNADIPTDPEQSSFVSTEDPAPVDSLESPSATHVDGLQLRINGELINVTQNNHELQAAAGDEIEIVGINYTYGGAEPEGVFAAETYINKLTDYANASLVDYNDGRFSDPSDDVPSTAGQATHNGVTGSWTLQEGWDRLTVNLMHYTSSGATVAGRFAVQLEVGTPDFAFETDVLDQIQTQTITVGDEVKIPVSWTNGASGQFHNYAEVDVYHGEKSGPIVWAGAVVGNADDANGVSGTATNTRGDFTHLWTPQEAGTYTLLYTVDPEHVWSESNELNNRYELIVEVSAANVAPVAKDDSTHTDADSDVQIDVTQNDYDPDGDEIEINDYSQGDNGTVTMNEDGSLTYTPDEDFAGEDQFKYSVTDGEDESNTAVVNIKVEEAELQVADASGNEDEWIPLTIEVDPSQVASVQIYGVPEGAELNHGEQVEDFHQVATEDLADLQIKHTKNSDVDFALKVAAVSHEGHIGSSAAIDVSVAPVYDGGVFKVQNFGIEAGLTGNLPHKFKLFDRDGSEIAKITINDLPDFISLSAGYRDGNDWVLDGDDMTRNLKVIAGFSDDTSGWSSYGPNYVYNKFSLTADVNAWEQASGEGGEGRVHFDMYFFQAN